jgi:hypothetical protein
MRKIVLGERAGAARFLDELTATINSRRRAGRLGGVASD